MSGEIHIIINDEPSDHPHLKQSLYLLKKTHSRTKFPPALPISRLQMYTYNDAAEDFDDIFTSSESALRYKQILPTLLTSVCIKLYSNRVFTPIGISTHLWHLTPTTKFSKSLLSELQDTMSKNSLLKTSFLGHTEVLLFKRRFVCTIEVA